MTSEFAKCINGSRCHIARISARPNASNTNLRVPAAGPVDEQNRLIGVLIEIANNLSDHDVNQPLLGAGVRGRCIPNPRQIMRKLQKQGAVDLGAFRRCGAQLLDATFKLGNPLNAPFQRASSSRATWRLAGSTSSYRRAARDAS